MFLSTDGVPDPRQGTNAGQADSNRDNRRRDLPTFDAGGGGFVDEGGNYDYIGGRGEGDADGRVGGGGGNVYPTGSGRGGGSRDTTGGAGGNRRGDGGGGRGRGGYGGSNRSGGGGGGGGEPDNYDVGGERACLSLQQLLLQV